MRKKYSWVTIIILMLLGGGILYAVSIYNEVSNTVETIHEPKIRKVSELRSDKVELEKKQPFSMLLLGVDERENDEGRSDTIIVLTVNPSTNSIQMVSIPRDTYTEIVGLEKKDKINHAFAFGGIDMALATVENLLDIPIDYVIQVNMESFLEIVDILGGVTVVNNKEFEVSGHTFQEGTLHLNGEQALDYVRMRKEDPQGDFGRQVRQKQVLQAILKEGATISSLWKYRDFLLSIQKNIRTNMTLSQMMDIQKGYKNTINQLDSLTFEKGEGKRINNIWYYMMDEEELQTATSKLKEHLEIK